MEGIKRAYRLFFAKKSIALSKGAWEAGEMNEEKAEALLREHLRTTYHPENQAG